MTAAQDRLDRLAERYAEEPVPPCRVCGRKLSIGSMGGGKATVWACSDRPKTAGQMNEWYDHYGDSRWTQYREGDSDVLAVVAALRAALDLHQPISEPPVPDPEDNVCSYDTTIEHPCPTVRIITHHLETP